MDRVRETGDVETMFAAEYFVTVDRARREALEDAARYGRELPGVVERGIRLEIAAGMRITEHAAGELIRRAEALVHRYPAALESLSRARMTVAHAEYLVDRLDECEPDVRDALVGDAVALAE
ncbi:MAG TPA: HNH endonuclease, partial [Microbacterium sp.]|nr:HNH endonuclease [Microbacterium sp.]